MKRHLSFLTLALVYFMVPWTSGKDIKFENCGGQVMSVNVDPCTEEVCAIPRGESVLISAHCISNVDAGKLRLTVWANIRGIEVPYPGMRKDACQGKNITCPISKDQHFRYVQKFEVKSFFPTIETKAKFILRTDDDQDKTVCCFIAPVKVV